MPNLDPASDIVERTREIVAGHAGRLGPLLPILHDVQHAFGHLPEESLRTIADRLNLSRAEVHGVASFYHDFRQAPAGRHVLKICQAEACQSMGSDAVASTLKAALGIGFHETSKDGSVTMEPVYCLGLCACAPSAMLDGELIGRVDEDAIDEIVEALRK